MFVEEYLQDVRRQHFVPRALVVYARRVAAHARADMLANPSAVRSIWTVALAYFAAAFGAAVALALAWHDRDLAERFLLQTSLWMLSAFAFITLFVGLLRDARGYRLSGLNLPLTLTLMRVALVPGISLFLVDRHLALALGIYLVAALSDVVDGLIARRWNQTTPLGTILDPLVDIVFNLAMLAGLAAAELLPAWVFWVAVVRYSLLVVGAACLYLFVGPVRIRPTSFGRLTGVVMTALIALYTLCVAVQGPLGAGLTRLTAVALGVLLSATIIQVLALGWYNLRVLTGAARQADHVAGDVRWGRR
ncbi:MAG TPA: CDP-alcohol phosphatidyltransferase family protein [Candidatus Eisenbacteria bacterium]|nr:CDP-alcohol phosphatidyltransferase family protein [Candidatus Eisenbacteria bacterium]